MAGANNDDDIPVLRDDQNKISRFSMLEFRRKDRTAAADLLREEIQRLKDAEEEATLCMDPNGVLLRFGEAFVGGYDDAEVAKHCAGLQEKKIIELQQLESEIDTIVSEMEQLKAALYAKFGTKRINLEFT